MRLPESIAIVVVAAALGEKKHIFVAAGRPVFDAFRGAVGFMPDDIAAQQPAVSLHGQGNSPGNAGQVLG